MVDDESKVLEVEYFEDFAGRVESKVWVCFIAMVGYFNLFGIYEDEFVECMVFGKVIGKILGIFVKYTVGIKG